MQHRRLSKFAAATAASVALVVSTAPAASAYGAFRRVDVTIPTVMSQSQLQDLLASQGYVRIKLSSILPNPAAPTPELNPDSGENPQTTPVHPGWNGRAFKNGERFAVLVVYGAGPSMAEVPPR